MEKENKSPKNRSGWYIARRVLLYYSLLVSTILIIGGFYSARTKIEIISNFLFLPVAVFLWVVLLGRKQKA